MRQGYRTGVFRLQAYRAGIARDFIGCLRALDLAYRHLYALEVDPSVVEVRLSRMGAQWPERLKIRVDLPREKALSISRIVIQSPGFVEVVGALNPFETIRKFLNDEDERRKDREYREEEDRRRLRMENISRAYDLLQKEIAIRKELNIPLDDIQIQLVSNAAKALSALREYQDSGMIGRIDLTA